MSQLINFQPLFTHSSELLFLWSALILYVASGCTAILTAIVWRKVPSIVPYFFLLGFIIHTLAIAIRWYRVDHGPFVTMFEIVSSNIWSFSLIWLIAFWKIKEIRIPIIFAQPILFMMMAWLLLTPSQETIFPATYHTIWLYIHVGFGKVFLGLFYLAVSLSVIILLRQNSRLKRLFRDLPANKNLSILSFRFVAAALVFQTLMLVAGAIWAQDAWGRYWAWDSLETWSFITWLLVVLLFHLKVTWKLNDEAHSYLIILIFIIAFVTFFGVPFISTAPHKGVV